MTWRSSAVACRSLSSGAVSISSTAARVSAAGRSGGASGSCVAASLRRFIPVPPIDPRQFGRVDMVHPIRSPTSDTLARPIRVTFALVGRHSEPAETLVRQIGVIDLSRCLLRTWASLSVAGVCCGDCALLSGVGARIQKEMLRKNNRSLAAGSALVWKGWRWLTQGDTP